MLCRKIEHLETLYLVQQAGCQFGLHDLSWEDWLGLAEFKGCLMILNREKQDKSNGR